MEYLRHKNGGGRIFGNDALISPCSFLDRRTEIRGEAQVWNSRLSNCIVGGSKGRSPVIVCASLAGSSIRSGDVMIAGAMVAGSTISGNVSVTGDVSKGGAQVTDCTLSGDVTVTGNATLKNLSLSGKYRIADGVWDGIAPRYAHLKDGWFDIGITEGLNGNAFVGCTEKPIKTWLKKADYFARAARWTPAMIRDLKRIFEQWLDATPQRG